MAFKTVGSLNPHGGPVLRSHILANSITFVEEDSVKFASGFVALGTTGALVAGHIQAIQTANGVAPTTTGAAGASIGTYVGTYATASDNQTVAKYVGVLDLSKFTLYTADPNAAIGTTTGSNLLGYYIDLADEDETSESSAATTTCQYLIHGVDPKDSGNHIVSVYESAVFGV